MIEYNLKNSFHINDFAFGLYCSNVLGFKDRVHEFKDRIVAFDKLYTNYENDYSLFSSYITNNIFLNAFELDKNVLHYEQYFYSTLQGYMNKHDMPLELINISKRWILITKAYKNMLDIVQDKKYKGISFDHLCFKPFKYIGNISRVSYHWHVPVLLEYSEGIDAIVMLPTNGIFTWYTNLYILSTLSYFKDYNLKTIYLYTIDINTGNIEYKVIHLNPEISNQLISSLDQLQVNFNITNFFNCSTCPYSSRCTQYQTLNVIKPTLYNSRTKIIKTLNKE